MNPSGILRAFQAERLAARSDRFSVKLRGMAEVTNPTLEDLASLILPIVRNNADLVPLLDFTAGAIFCLMKAKRLGFKDRPGPLHAKYQASVTQYITEMSEGRFPQNRLWIAGWHFNSALVRIAAAYERAMKSFSGRKNGNRKELLKDFSPFTHAKLDAVYEEVNSLKHDVNAGEAGRTVSFQEAIDALAELVAFINLPSKSN